MSKTPTITLGRDTVRHMAFDVANEFFTDEELCIRYDLTLGQLKYVRSQPAFHKAVLQLKQDLADDGKQLLLKARDYVLEVLAMYKEIVDDTDNSPTTRMNAGDKIMELARVKVVPGQLAPGSLPGGGVAHLHIHTNLALEKGALDGAYVATAKKPRIVNAEPIEDAEVIEYDPAAGLL